ncbi:MAG: McrC family protein [Firmicutes bacterium]|nr:McrC family protein [Bacillota bacterium]
MESINLKPFSIEEQQFFGASERVELKELNLDFQENEIRYLGLNPYNFGVSYYIGIDWLKENESYIVVHPKIPNLDYVKMFVNCLKYPDISKFLKNAYCIDFNKPQIRTSTVDWNLTPFLIVHFISLVENIIKHDLKSNYIVNEENLNSKIKGKIVFSQQIKKNIVCKREDRIYCRYQEYDTNCIENRLLKKTLLFIQRYSKHHMSEYPAFLQKQNRLLSAFDNISDEISYSDIIHIKNNALYKEYTEAIDLAKKILRHFGYSYKNADIAENKELPPFWINMSKLFELYIFCLLKDEYGGNITYQQRGNYGEVDFLKIDEKLIIDAKYKLVYTKDGEYDIENIRQLSGYARDKGVLKKLKVDENFVVDCVIIYPDEKSDDNFKDRNLKNHEIEQFAKFYKCGICLPKKKNKK